MGDCWRHGLDGLIRRSADQDQQAFAELIQSVRPVFRRFLQKRLPTDAVDDVLQEIFARVWMKATSYKGTNESGSPPDAVAGAWIFTIARNQCNDHLRKLKIYRQSETQAADMTAERQDTDDPPEPFENIPDPGSITFPQNVIDQQGIEAFRGQLDETDRQIFDLIAQGYKQKEAARMLGLTPAAICQHMKEIRAQARTFLN